MQPIEKKPDTLETPLLSAAYLLEAGDIMPGGSCSSNEPREMLPPQSQSCSHPSRYFCTLFALSSAANALLLFNSQRNFLSPNLQLNVKIGYNSFLFLTTLALIVAAYKAWGRPARYFSAASAMGSLILLSTNLALDFLSKDTVFIVKTVDEVLLSLTTFILIMVVYGARANMIITQCENIDNKNEQNKLPRESSLVERSVYYFSVKWAIVSAISLAINLVVSSWQVKQFMATILTTALITAAAYYFSDSYLYKKRKVLLAALSVIGLLFTSISYGVLQFANKKFSSPTVNAFLLGFGPLLSAMAFMFFGCISKTTVDLGSVKISMTSNTERDGTLSEKRQNDPDSSGVGYVDMFERYEQLKRSAVQYKQAIRERDEESDRNTRSNTVLSHA